MTETLLWTKPTNWTTGSSGYYEVNLSQVMTNFEYLKFHMLTVEGFSEYGETIIDVLYPISTMPKIGYVGSRPFDGMDSSFYVTGTSSAGIALKYNNVSQIFVIPAGQYADVNHYSVLKNVYGLK